VVTAGIGEDIIRRSLQRTVNDDYSLDSGKRWRIRLAEAFAERMHAPRAARSSGRYAAGRGAFARSTHP